MAIHASGFCHAYDKTSILGQSIDGKPPDAVSAYRDARPPARNLMSDYPVFDALCELLNTSGARFRVLDHPAEGKSDVIAALRGTRPEQGAKAMLCTFKDGGDATALAVIPGHLKIDFRKVADAVGRRKATLAPPELAATVTRA